METGGLSEIDVVLLALLIINVVLILSAYGLFRWFKQKSETAIGEIGKQIQGYDDRLSQIIDFLQDYSGVDQEPYSTRLDELQGETSELRGRIEHFLEECKVFDHAIHASAPNHMQEIINAPFHWFRRWKRTSELRRESEAIAGQLSAAESRVECIYALPWELATQCRQAEKDLAELAQLAQMMQSRNARGARLQTVLTQLPLLRQSLEAIPKEFLSADEETLLASANLDSAIRVFEILNRVKTALNQYLPKAREWDTAYQKASGDYAELKTAGANLRQAIAHPPEGLVANGLQIRLDQTAQLAAEINQRLTQPDVEDLKPLAREVSQVRKVVQDIEQQYKRAGQQVADLGKVLPEVTENIEKLAARFSELEHREFFPLAWDESSPLLSELRKSLQALGPAQQPRPPELITQHLKDVEKIRAGHKTRSEALARVAEQHAALAALLESPEIREGTAWLRKARETLTQASIYDPRNWNKQDSIQTLPAELEELSKRHEEIIPADRSAPLLESQLSQRLKDTQAIANRHKELRPRVKNVRDRLERIRVIEAECNEKLNESYTSLERISLLLNSNEMLEAIASDEIDRLLEEIRQLGNELNAQAQGEIEKKQQKIQAQAEKVNRSLNAWLARLNASITEQGRNISVRLSQLDAIALLNDPPVNDARNLLEQDAYSSAVHGGQVAPPPASGLRKVAARVAEHTPLQRAPLANDLEATAEIKSKNDFWQRMIATQQALEASIGDLLAAYQEAIQARNETLEDLAEIDKRLSDKRAWPPNNQPPLSETQVLRPVDEKWEALKKQPRKAENAAVELRRLAQQYTLAGERTRQALERINQDQERVQELEERIESLKQRWQSQVQADPDSPVIRAGVQQLMSQADTKLVFIKHQYTRGTISYEEVIHNLQFLYDELFSARVVIDEQSDIGLNEKAPKAHPASNSNGYQNRR